MFSICGRQKRHTVAALTILFLILLESQHAGSVSAVESDEQQAVKIYAQNGTCYCFFILVVHHRPCLRQVNGHRIYY